MGLTRVWWRRAMVSMVFTCAAWAMAGALAQDRAIVMASTTSTQESGLFGHLLPLFKRESGIDIRVIALGTGQALDMARRGDADALFVHDTAAEEKFVADGFAVKRWPVMFNDFVLVGPAADPLQLRGNDIAQALARLSSANAAFVSRGDKSGTHAAELRLWQVTGTDMTSARPAAFTNYRSCGCGMGAALNMASSTDAYALADRGTWLAFKNRGALAILVQGDRRLANQYGVMVVNPVRHPHVKAAPAQAFVDWLISPAGQAAIASYRIGGEQLFFPNAKP